MAVSHALPIAARHSHFASRLSQFLLFLLVSLCFIWPLTFHPDFVPFPPRAAFSDLVITHLPNALYLRDSLSRFGQWPLWNAQILAGQPFAADPLAGMWYPPNVLLILLPLPLAFNLLFALHLAWAGLGLATLLRADGLSDGPALFGGLAFCGTPKLIAHLGAGHASLVFAVAWTPWVLLAVKRAAEAGGLRRGAAAGVCLALLFLADVRWAFFAGLLGAAYWVSLLPPFGPRREGRASLLAACAFALIFLSLSAVLSVPLGQFLLASNRRALSLAEAATYSLPPRYFLGLLIPDVGGFHEWMTYLGVIPLLLVPLGLNRRTLFWGGSALVAAGFSLGSNFVLFPFLFRALPGLGLLRVPPRAWFVVALGVCVVAAHGMSTLVARAIPWYLARLGRGAAWTARVLPALMLLTFADLLRVDSTLLDARPAPARVPAAEWIAAQPGHFRVYSPSYSLPLGDGLQHVDGVDPLQLDAAVRFIEAAIGVRARCYSVTVPAFEPDEGDCGASDAPIDMATVNQAAVLDAARLGRLNVRYIAAEFPLDAPELRLVQTFGGMRVYENTLARPRAWMENGGPAEDVVWSPNRIRVTARGPGRLVLSEITYPGWQARVDGSLTPIEPFEGVLRSVRLGAGEHEVVFEFSSRAVSVGVGISAPGLIALAVIWQWGRRHGRPG